MVVTEIVQCSLREAVSVIPLASFALSDLSSKPHHENGQKDACETRESQRSIETAFIGWNFIHGVDVAGRNAAKVAQLL